MQRVAMTLVLLSLVATSCSGSASAVEAACDRVELAQQISVTAISGEVSRDAYRRATAALDSAHEAVSDLSSRAKRRLVRDCEAVSAVGSARFRLRDFSAVATDLEGLESAVRDFDIRLAALEAAEAKLAADIRFACDAFTAAESREVLGAGKRLDDLSRAVELLQVEWSEDETVRFAADCDLEIDRDWGADVAALTAVAAAEQQEIERVRAEQAAEAQRQAEERARQEAEAAQRETAEMLSVLIEMEAAWRSISRADRATVCAMFRQDRVGTAQQWVRLSGYGKPEYAFVFLSQAC